MIIPAGDKNMGSVCFSERDNELVNAMAMAIMDTAREYDVSIVQAFGAVEIALQRIRIAIEAE